MKKFIIPVFVLIIALSTAFFFWQKYSANNGSIGGDRDSHGCLIAAGYGFDNNVGACIRAFEMTPDIKRAAKLATDKIGPEYALTVVSFDSYEEPGSYDLTFEKGLARKKEIVYIKNWQIVQPDTRQAVQNILAQKYHKPLSEVKVTVNKEVPGYAAGSVMFGKGGPGESGMWLAVLGNGWQVVWDGNGSVDCKTIREYGFPDTIIKPNYCD